MSHVKTPLVQKAEGKRSEPPAGLPVGVVTNSWDIPKVVAESEETRQSTFKTDAGEVADDGEIKLG
jgi:hypothetical protein